jgi:hypothetical protein
MNRIGHIAAALAILLACVERAAAQVTCPVLSGGGTVHSDGTILAIGQFATGAIGDLSGLAEQGAVPCWIDEVACPGDLNSDAQVDIQDLATLLANFGTTSGAGPGDGDLDGDGDVDIQDLAAILSAFGSSCP